MKTPTVEEVILHTRRLQEGQHMTQDGDDFVCGHCGTRYTPPLPLPLPDYIAEMDAFQVKHLECKPGGAQP
jgi:hypothetical protein